MQKKKMKSKYINPYSHWLIYNAVNLDFGSDSEEDKKPQREEQPAEEEITFQK